MYKKNTNDEGGRDVPTGEAVREPHLSKHSSSACQSSDWMILRYCSQSGASDSLVFLRCSELNCCVFSGARLLSLFTHSRPWPEATFGSQVVCSTALTSGVL